LNNYRFSGHQKWSELKDIYSQWSTLIDINYIAVIGGEPTLNPDLKNWLIGIRELWPDTPIELITNGSRLVHTPWLYEVLHKYKIDVIVSTHNISRTIELANVVEEMLDNPKTTFFKGTINHVEYNGEESWDKEYNIVKGEHWPECKTFEDFINLPDNIRNECISVHNISPQPLFTDSNGVKVRFQHDNQFITAPLKYAGNNQFQVYNNDLNAAHDVCISKTCHHFIRGKLYKCHHVPLLLEFMEQYQVNLSKSDTQLLKNYAPATVGMDINNIKQFIDNLENAIPQCKLCPAKEDLKTVLIHADNVKPKILKLPLTTP